ncbi:hypothetical protein EPN81_04000 [Patescibacteria group bacterium]|nr:MAG: hypothetical protein EPN81_04000 [Patescibacteria group bacterium]
MTAATLTIARALRRAKTLEGRVAELTKRLSSTTTWREDAPPAFEFEATLKEHDAAVEELLQLRTGVARANATATLEFEGRTMCLTEAIRRQAELKGRLTLFAGFSLRAGVERVHVGYDERHRPSYEEVAHTAVWSEPERANKLEELRARLESLNEALETANHGTVVRMTTVEG